MKTSARRFNIDVLGHLSRCATTAPMIVGCLVLSECELVYSALYDLDVQGGAGWFCQNTELSTVRGPHNLVVSAHATECETTVTYVYLHDAKVPERSSNQIFRYDGVAPKIAWTALDQVSITVDGARDIDKQVTKLNGIEIVYKIDPARPFVPPVPLR